VAQEQLLSRDPSLINVTLRPITTRRDGRIDLTACAEWRAARYPTERVLAPRHARNRAPRCGMRDDDLVFRPPLSGNAANGIRARLANDSVKAVTVGAFSQAARVLAGFPLARSRVSIHL
jgi:hypothetical protein